MRHFSLPLFLLAVLFQVETARSTEPSATCKLKLVHLELWPLGKPWPEDEQFVRHVRPQSFRTTVSNKVVDRDSQEAEKGFHAVVRKEPKEYQAEYPLRAVATFSGKKHAFVLDKQSKKSPGYDRLYFDRSGNGDLTHDAPIDVPKDAKTWESVPLGKRLVSSYQFPRVDFRIHAEGSEWDYSVIAASQTITHDNNLSVSAYFVPAAYRQGEIMLQGSKHKIILVDFRTSGRFDVPVSFAKDGTGVDGFFGQYGTEILFDHEIQIDKHLGYSYISEHRQFLAKMNALGGRFYRIKITPGGDELTFTPVVAPLGKITMPHTPCNVWLINEQGLLALDLPNATPVDIPAGKWRLLYYTLWRFDGQGGKAAQAGAMNKSGADAAAPKSDGSKSPKIIYTDAYGDCGCEPVTVVANQATIMKIGPPYMPTLKAERKGKVAMLALEIRGIGQEKIYPRINGISQSKQKLRITDPQGKVVEQGNFEYG